MAKRLRCPHCGDLQPIGPHFKPFELIPMEIPCTNCRRRISTNFAVRAEITGQRLSRISLSSALLCFFIGTVGVPIPFYPVEIIMIGSLLFGIVAGSILYYLAAAPLQTLLELTTRLHKPAPSRPALLVHTRIVSECNDDVENDTSDHYSA